MRVNSGNLASGYSAGQLIAFLIDANAASLLDHAIDCHDPDMPSRLPVVPVEHGFEATRICGKSRWQVDAPTRSLHIAAFHQDFRHVDRAEAQLFDVRRTEREAMVDPDGICDDFSREAVAFQARHGG